MKKYLFALFLFFALVAPASPQLASFTNRPTGSTVWVDCAWTSITPNPMPCSHVSNEFGVGNEVHFVDVTAPLDDGNVLRQCATGGDGFVAGQFDTSFPAGQTVAYVGFYFKHDYNGINNSFNKITFLQTDGTAGWNTYVMGYSNASTSDWPLYLDWQTSQLNNCQMPQVNNWYGSCAGALTNIANIPINTWTKIEYAVQFSTTATSQDGKLRFYVNGSLVYSADNMNWPGHPINAQISTTWDDTVGSRFAPSSVNCQYMNHYVVAYGGTLVGGTPDTTPPTVPGSFAITADGSASWTASTDNIGVTSYTLLFCTPSSCTPAQSVTTTTNLFATVAQTGDYAVWANDAAGNHSVLSNVISFTAPTVFRTTLAVDDFQRANNTDLGAAWDSGYTGDTNLQILSGIVECTAFDSNCDESYNAVAAPNNQWARVILHTIQGSVASQAGVILQMNNPGSTMTGYGCLARFNDATKKGYIYRFSEGTSAIIMSDNTIPFVSGDIVDCEKQGSTLTMTRIRNGVSTLIGQVTDSTFSSGKVGIYGSVLSGGTLADIQFGNFSFGGFDVVPPAQPSITGLTLDATGADVTWSSSPAPTQIRIADDRTSVVEPLSSFPAGRYTWTSILDGLTFKCMFAINSLGVENTVSADYRCGSLAGIANPLDTAPPTMSNGLPSANLPAGTTSTTISLNINKPATCRYDTTDPVEDATGYALLANTMTVSSLTASAPVSGLTNGSTHTYYVRCQSTDAIDTVHPDLTSLVITVVVDSSTADTTPPTTVTNLVGQVLSSTQVSLQWTNATDAGGVAGYWVYLCFLSDCSDAVPATTQIVPTNTLILNLAPTTQYYAAVKAVDTSNNFSAAYSNIITFTTGPVLDVEPPSTMTNLRIKEGPYTRSATLTWDPGTDNMGSVFVTIEICPHAESVCVESDFVTVVSKVALDYLVVSLTPSTTYTARGKFSDTFGNPSVAYSNLLEFTTAASGLPRPRLEVPPSSPRSSPGARSSSGTRLPRP